MEGEGNPNIICCLVYCDGVYLCQVHPTAPDGSRKREYNGKDPARQQAALARPERFKRHAIVTQEINCLGNRLEATNRQLENIVSHLINKSA